MKNLRRMEIILILVVLGLVTNSCVHDDDFSVPEIDATEPDVNVNTTIKAVKGIFRGFEPKLIATGDGSNNEMYLEGYVGSNDEAGNFYKSLVIQDTPENPTAGVTISTNATDLYTKYEPGRKIYFRVDGLFIGLYAGLPTIGLQGTDEIERMQIDDFEARIFRSLDIFEIVPQIVTLPQVLDSGVDYPYQNPYLNILVQFQDVQFPEILAGESYGNLNNTYSVNRPLEDCDGTTIYLRVSGFSDFKNLLLPEGNGIVTAIVSIFNSSYQVFIRDTDDVQMEGLRCDGGGGTGTILFSEDFEGQPAGSGIVVNIVDWTNVNVNGGARLWEVRESSSNKYAQTSAFNSGESPFEVWLVTPEIALPDGSSPILTFETKDAYNNGTGLTAKISTNFTGDVSAATWTDLSAVIATGNTSNYGSDFTPSGEVDLSAYAGQTVYIAYQYLGASTGINTRYQIDTIVIIQ